MKENMLFRKLLGDLRLNRSGFLKHRDELNLGVLLELILFIRSLDKMKGHYFLITWNKFYFPVSAAWCRVRASAVPARAPARTAAGTGRTTRTG